MKKKRSSKVERALRYPTYVACGTPPDNVNVYFASDISAARARAINAQMYSYNNFPKQFYNRENLNMHGCTGPLYEFPLIMGGLYGNDDLSWDPLAERVIIDCSGNLCAVITHKGARGRNGFVECNYHY